MSQRMVGDIKGFYKVDFDSSNGLRIYEKLYNAHTASRAAGLPCFFDHTATANFGLQVKQCAAANQAEFAGLHVETVTSGAWGWVQREGYYASAVMLRYGTASGANAAAGDKMKGSAGADYLIYNVKASDSAATYHAYAIRVASCASTDTATATTAAEAIIKAV